MRRAAARQPHSTRPASGKTHRPREAAPDRDTLVETAATWVRLEARESGVRVNLTMAGAALARLGPLPIRITPGDVLGVARRTLRELDEGHLA